VVTSANDDAKRGARGTHERPSQPVAVHRGWPNGNPYYRDTGVV